MKRVDVAVYADINSGKSLSLQAIFKGKIGIIVLIISLTMTLIKHQVDELLILLNLL